jgi:hypothetical protein
VCAGISATSLQRFLTFVKTKLSDDKAHRSLERTVQLLAADTAAGIALGLFHFAASGLVLMGRVMTHAAPGESYNLLLVSTIYTFINFFTLAGTLSLSQVAAVRAPRLSCALRLSCRLRGGLSGVD